MAKDGKSNPYFIECYSVLVGPLEITDEDYARGKAFADGLRSTHEALKGIGAFGIKYFEGGLNGGVLVVEPEFPIERTVTKEGSSYQWMVDPETTLSSDLVVTDYLIVKPSRTDPEALVASAVSPGYRRGNYAPSLQEEFSFNPLEHTLAIIHSRLEGVNLSK